MRERCLTPFACGLIMCLLSACGGPPSAQAPAPSDVAGEPTGPTEATNPPYVGRIWIATGDNAPRGSMRAFLGDGTLLMTSCVETYRLARWTLVGPGRIAWTEDGARIEADVAQAKPDGLVLRLHLVSGFEEEHYRLASVPYVCPDLRPSP